MLFRPVSASAFARRFSQRDISLKNVDGSISATYAAINGYHYQLQFRPLVDEKPANAINAAFTEKPERWQLVPA